MVLDRRNILKFLAGGAVGSMLTPMTWKLTDDISIWTQNWPWIPRLKTGRIDAAPAVVKLGGPEYGILVTTVGGRPVTAQGDPAHPLSRGGIDPLAAASVQLLYSPARIKGPLRRTASGGFRSISWSEAAAILKRKLEEASREKDQIACISGDPNGSSTEILSSFLAALNSEAFYFLPGDSGVQTRLWNGLMHGRGILGFDTARSDCVLALGPDLLGDWGTAVRTQHDFGSRHPDVIVAGPAQNATSAVAGSWLPVDAAGLGHLALAIAYHLLSRSAHASKLPGFSSFAAFVRREYSPRKATQKTGLGPDTVRSLAKRLARAKRPVVVSGSLAWSGASGFTHWAGICLNLLLKGINAPGGLQALPQPSTVLSGATPWSEVRSRDLMGYVYAAGTWRRNPPKVLFCFESNPAYSLPDRYFSTDFLDMVDFKVSCSQFMDETAAVSDLILPHPYFLERFDDCQTPFGAAESTYSQSSPIVAPHTDSRSIPDFILSLSADMGLSLGTASFQDVLAAKAASLGADWRKVPGCAHTWTSKRTISNQEPALWTPEIEKMARSAQQTSSSPGLTLVAGQDLKTGTPQSGIPPFGLKALREEELPASRLPARLNRATARSLGLGQGDLVRVSSPQGPVCRAEVELDEGVMPDHVGMPLGFGHTEWDEFNRGKGANVHTLYSVRMEKGSGVSTWADSTVHLEKIAPARS